MCSHLPAVVHSLFDFPKHGAGVRACGSVCLFVFVRACVRARLHVCFRSEKIQQVGMCAERLLAFPYTSKVCGVCVHACNSPMAACTHIPDPTIEYMRQSGPACQRAMCLEGL